MTGLFKRTRELIKSPKGVDKRQKNMSTALATQVTHLMNDGWVPKAIAVYVDHTVNNEALTDKTMNRILSENWAEAHRIGSALFTEMFAAGFHRGGLPAADRLDMLYKILGMTVSSSNFVKMTRLGNWQLRETIEDADLYYYHIESLQETQSYFEFVKQVAYMMRLKHHAWNGIRSKYETSRQLSTIIDNQFRYYLSKPIVDFIVCHQWHQNDVSDRILELTGTPVSYPDAQFHNRGVAKKDNIKVALPGYHLELIFDHNGQIVSMWPVLEKHQITNEQGVLVFSEDPATYSLAELQMIANTESANYANAGGQIHQSLDVMPANRYAGLESDLRNFAKNQF